MSNDIASKNIAFADYRNTQKRTGIKREPAMTLKELADKRGMSYSTVRRKFAKTGKDVEVAFEGKLRRTYYIAIQLEMWADQNT